MKLLENKVAIITGGGRGIGRAAALLFASHGANVVISDIDEAPALETAASIKSAGGNVIVIPGDIIRSDVIQSLVEETVSVFHGIDILVNNAGYTWDGMMHKMTDDQWDAMIAIHLTAPFHLIRAAVPYMRDAAKNELDQQGVARARKIVNVSSTTGTRGKIGQVNYAAVKAGVLGLTRTLAKEWGRFNIQVNAAAFGMIDTRLTQPKNNSQLERNSRQISLGIPEDMRQTAMQTIPMGRPGTPEEAAGVLLFFASALSDYVSGQVLEVTGGL